jgi:capsule polysaccharide export protein KpsE/RkpR
MYLQSVPFVLIFLTILAGILLNNKGLSDLKSEMKGDLRAEISRIDARLNGIQSDLNQFYGSIGRLEGRIEALEKRVA